MVSSLIGQETFTNILCRYLICINIFSFFLFAFDLARHTKTGKTVKPVWLFMFVTIVGGALGVNLYFLVFFPRLKRNNAKYNVYHDAKDYYSYWRIFAFVMLLLDVFLLMMARDVGILSLPYFEFPKFLTLPFSLITQKLSSLNLQHKWLPVWLVIINAVTFITYGIDKKKAISGEYRIPEKRLYFLAIIGGSIGALLAMRVFHHKTQKQSFNSGIPLCLLLNVISIIYIIHRGWA